MVKIVRSDRGRRQHRQEYNIKIEFKEIASEGVDWINLVQDKG
jgi:hypothetical protein